MSPSKLTLLCASGALVAAVAGSTPAHAAECSTARDGDTFVDRIIGAGYARRNGGWTLGGNLAWGTGDFGAKG